MKKGDWAAFAGVASMAGLGLAMFMRRRRAIEDLPFLMQAAQSGQRELQLAQLALNRTHNDEVRAFAEMLIEDHRESNHELKRLARSLGVRLSARPDARVAETVNRLSALSGTGFDRALLDTLISDHIRAIAIFSHERGQGCAPAIRDFAARNVPALQEHLSVARALVSHLGRVGAARR